MTCPRFTKLAEVYSLQLGPGSCQDLEQISPVTVLTQMMSKVGGNSDRRIAEGVGQEECSSKGGTTFLQIHQLLKCLPGKDF